MYPKLIHSEEEYEAALAHVETLMDAEPGSPQEDELEVWALLIENYEKHQGLGIPAEILVREPDPDYKV